jgi:DNA-binding response OmpR family regulator
MTFTFGASMNILLVDDNELLLSTRKLIFERAGYRVIAAKSGADALAACSTEPVDLAIVDYYLPDTTGDDLCKQIKAGKPKMQLILASGTIPDHISDCPDFFVLKGGSPLDLIRKVGELTRAA